MFLLFFIFAFPMQIWLFSWLSSIDKCENQSGILKTMFSWTKFNLWPHQWKRFWKTNHLVQRSQRSEIYFRNGRGLKDFFSSCASASVRLLTWPLGTQGIFTLPTWKRDFAYAAWIPPLSYWPANLIATKRGLWHFETPDFVIN